MCSWASAHKLTPLLLTVPLDILVRDKAGALERRAAPPKLHHVAHKAGVAGGIRLGRVPVKPVEGRVVAVGVVVAALRPSSSSRARVDCRKFEADDMVKCAGPMKQEPGDSKQASQGCRCCCCSPALAAAMSSMFRQTATWGTTP